MEEVGRWRLGVGGRLPTSGAVGPRWTAAGGRVRWGGGSNNRSGQASGRERECGRTHDWTRARMG
jgi:hypothetical protein